MHRVYSLFTFIVFLLYVSVSHSPSSGKTFYAPHLKPGIVMTLLTVVYTVFMSYMMILLQPTGHVMHQQFNIQQLYAVPTLYLRVLYLSENKQRLVPLTA